jgi:hypothetical protein
MNEFPERSANNDPNEAGDPLAGAANLGAGRGSGATAAAAAEKSGGGGTNADESGTDVGALAGLLNRVDGNRAPCTCNPPKQPGQGGQHQKTCSRRHNATGHFAPFVVSRNEPIAAKPVALVPEIELAPSRDTSFYGEAVRDLYAKRVDVAVQKKLAKHKPTLTLIRKFGLGEEADMVERLIEKGRMPEERLKAIGDAFAEAANRCGLPEVNPLAKGLYYIAEWEIGEWLRNQLIATQLDRIAAAMEEKKQPNVTADA